MNDRMKGLGFGKRHVGWSLLAIACLCGLLTCAARRPSPVRDGWFQVGNLALPWPAQWRLLPGTPAHTPPNVDRACDCSRLGPHISNRMVPGLAGRLGVIWTGLDTLILDTVHVALWPGDCFEPCYAGYDSVLAAEGLPQLFARQDDLAGYFRGKTLYHRVLPSSDVHVLGGAHFYHYDGSGLRPGRSGIYFRGNAQQRPLSLYGINLQRATIDELWKVMKGVVWRGKGQGTMGKSGF